MTVRKVAHISSAMVYSRIGAVNPGTFQLPDTYGWSYSSIQSPALRAAPNLEL